jgi:hypothetical protein
MHAPYRLPTTGEAMRVLGRHRAGARLLGLRRGEPLLLQHVGQSSIAAGAAGCLPCVRARPYAADVGGGHGAIGPRDLPY